MQSPELTTLSVLRHALNDVRNNWNMAKRIFAGPILLTLAIPLVISLLATGKVSLTGQNASSELWNMAESVFVSIIVIAAAVSWHRFILLGDGYTGLAKQFSQTQIIKYFWTVFGLVILLMIVGLLVVAGIGRAFGNAALETYIETIFIVLALPLYYIAIRLSLLFPAIATDTPMKMRKSWALSSPYGSAIWGLAGLMLCAFAVNFSFTPNNAPTAFLNWVVMTAQWVIPIPIVTALYDQIQNQSAAK